MKRTLAAALLLCACGTNYTPKRSPILAIVGDWRFARDGVTYSNLHQAVEGVPEAEAYAGPATSMRTAAVVLGALGAGALAGGVVLAAKDADTPTQPVSRYQETPALNPFQVAYATLLAVGGVVGIVGVALVGPQHAAMLDAVNEYNDHLPKKKGREEKGE